MTVSYILSKLLKKLRGKSILNSSIHKTSKAESGSLVVDSNMDRYSFCGYDCEIINTEIGSFCSIANNVIIGGAMHPMNWVSTSPVFYKGRDSVRKKFSTFELPANKRTVIGHDVWIGNNVLIKQGVKISTGAVVGMGSVVTKDIPPYEIWGGNPAKLIRKRFDDKTIIFLLESKWWKKDNIELEKMAKYFNDVEKFMSL